MSDLRNRLAWFLRRLADRVEWHEPECKAITADGRRCGYYRRAGVHDHPCPRGADCPAPGEHHEFVR